MQTKQKNGTLTQQEAEKYIWSSRPVYKGQARKPMVLTVG